MVAAIKKVLEKECNYEQASVLYNVPRVTLFRRVREIKEKQVTNVEDVCKKSKTRN